MTAPDPLAQLDDWPVAHAAAAIVGPDGIVGSHGDVDAIFELASVTKPLTALAVLVAVDEEAVSLTDPVDEDLLPGATLRHLLSHASGMGGQERKRRAAPGERRLYSNAGIESAADHVARSTGIAFPSYLSQAVLEPLRLTGTTLYGSPASEARSTVRDIARVVQELLAPRGLLAAATREELASVQYPGIGGVLPGYGRQDLNDWGLGLEIRGTKSPHWTGTANSPATFGHFGQSGTMMWIDPAAGVGLVALADRGFDDWARSAWPALSDAVLAAS